VNLFDRFRDFLDAHTHRPSTCCTAYGRHLSDMLVHDLVPERYPYPGPFRCPCPCRRCRREECPTAGETGFALMLAKQRARTRPL
jgi:hypothetical protein